MSEEKKSRVTRIGERRDSQVSKGVRAAIMQDQQGLGGNEGDFTRSPCGTCLSWRRLKQAGQAGVPLNVGMCLRFPPVAHPVMDEAGRIITQTLARPIMPSDYEGCDEHDDGTDDEEGDGTPATGSILAAAG